MSDVVKYMGSASLHHCLDMDTYLQNWAVTYRGVGRGTLL